MMENVEPLFAALGGIGKNCALYGFGPPKKKKWLMVDLGAAFARRRRPSTWAHCEDETDPRTWPLPIG
jgi:hypothetical protein